MIDIDDSKAKFAREPSEFCQACERMSVENLATDWDHIAHSTLGSMGGRKYYFNEGDKIIPLCRAHHTERHMIGWIAFKAKYGLTDDDLVTLTDYQALDRNELHYQHQRKHKNKGMA